ncbi:unnamed protein product [Didymodactylos carnosus]|uniref:Tubulin polyglutamylase complex subunit 1-like C-terminal domain-containing protein n=1 Tax=Didymodactylos carnosus TaxID=1234261 RepID=A0A814AYQ1_9BILA|nr:unnamed protein product [Didymodactylos carnosus]CAF1061832.1 unnamed protein product [Didymodactylos carnosus]CAF3701000.1 unnamed protein product [Didymodactylos carnosus]CAF3827265.1 unnamed protein product [Didymodactylos carnosus]
MLLRGCYSYSLYKKKTCLLFVEYEKIVQTFYNQLALYSDNNVDHTLCELLIQTLNESLKTNNDAYSLHESVLKLSPFNLNQLLERSYSRSTNSKNLTKISYDEFLKLAFTTYLNSMKKIT